MQPVQGEDGDDGRAGQEEQDQRVEVPGLQDLVKMKNADVNLDDNGSDEVGFGTGSSGN